MGELKREIEQIKEDCRRDPGTRAGWIVFLIALGFGLFLVVSALPIITLSI